MPMTVLVVRNGSGRIRGFLASCACELAPGVYTISRMSQGVRERVWGVLEDWTTHEPGCSVVMTWPDRTQPSGQSVWLLGTPACDLVVIDGLTLVRRNLPGPEPEAGTLTTERSGQ